VGRGALGGSGGGGGGVSCGGKHIVIIEYAQLAS